MVENIPKIGLLVGSLRGAGAEKTILTLADFLARKNCLVYLFVLNETADYDAPNNIQVIHLKGDSRKNKQISLKMITDHEKYDLFISSRADYYNHIISECKYVSVHISPYSWIKNERKSVISKYLGSVE